MHSNIIKTCAISGLKKRIKELAAQYCCGIVPAYTLKSREQREKEAVENVLNEKDPQKIIELARIPPSNEYAVYPVKGYKEKIAAAENPDTPTIFLLYLYHYPKLTIPVSDFNPLTPIGPRPHSSPPYVTDEVRKAVKAALISRDWELTEWEEENLSPAEIYLFTRQLEKDKKKEELNNMLRESESDTPLGKISKELIDRLGI